MIEVADSLVVKFGGGADASDLAKLELDDLLNEDKTSFAPGDTIYLRLHHDSSVQLNQLLSTDGMVSSEGSGSRDIEEQLLFAEAEDSHELGYVVEGALAFGYYGRQATGLKRTGQRQVIITGGDLPSLALVQYTASFSLFKLLAPDVELEEDESYPITIVAYMEAVT